MSNKKIIYDEFEINALKFKPKNSTQQLFCDAWFKQKKEIPINSLIEEMAELTLELSRIERDRGDIIKITEEAVDVFLNIQSFMILLNPELTEYFKRIKLDKFKKGVYKENAETSSKP